MKFLYVAPRLHPNFHYQLEALIAGGHEVEFFALHSARGEVHASVRPTVFGYSPLFTVLESLLSREEKKHTRSRFELIYSFPPIGKFFSAVRRSRADVLVVKNIASAYSVLALIVGWLLGKRLIVFLSIEKHRPKKRSWSVSVVGKVFGARVITPLLGDRRYPNLNDSLFYVPLPHPVLPRAEGYAPGGITRIICVGKFSKRKDQLLLLQAAAALKDEFRFSLTFIGLTDEDTYLGEMNRYIDAEGLRDRVTLTFDVPWDRVYEEYARHDLFVLPSYDELHSFAALEAMSLGLPAIVTDDNGIQWYIKDGESGYVVRRRDLDGLIRALHALLADPARLSAMGANAQAAVRSACSLEGYEATMVRLASP